MGIFVADGYESVADQLTSLAAADPDYSAQVCAFHRGQRVVDASVGPRFGVDDLVPVYSSSKGAVAACVALLIEDRQIDLDDPVARYWPEFGAEGKGDITVRLALSHQAGLVGWRGGYTVEELVAHTPIAERLAAMRPLWRPGSAHGYHGITIGTIVDELIRRISGLTFHEFYAQRIRGPLGLDLHFGLGEHDPATGRVVSIEPPVLPPGTRPGDVEPRPDSLMALAVNRRDGFPGMVELGNDQRIRAVGPPAMGGIGSARGLAGLYSALMESAPVSRLVSTRTIERMSQTQVAGLDLVLELHDRFAIVFQTPDARLAYGSPWAFGHDGAGGSIGFADPAYDLAFGYVTNRIPVPGGADVRGLALAAVTRASASVRARRIDL